MSDTAPDEQRQQWMTIAQAQLTAFKMSDAQIEWLAFTHHPVFDVQHGDDHYTLHLYEIPQTYRKPLHDQLSLQQLLDKHGLCVPAPHQSHGDDTLVAALMHYVAGENRSPDDLTPDDAAAIGRYLARLHALDFDAHAFTRPRLDYAGMFGETGAYYLDAASAAIFTDVQQETMHTAQTQVKAAMAQLSTGDAHFGLVHADLLLQNVLFRDAGAVCALDWEYCGWGYYVYDLTPLLWQLKTQPTYAALESAMVGGYTSQRELSSEERDLLETFIVARHIASMRWVARNRDNPNYQGKVEGILAQRTAQLQHFLETGTLDRTLT